MLILPIAAIITMARPKLIAFHWAWVSVLDGTLHAMLYLHDVDDICLLVAEVVLVL